MRWYGSAQGQTYGPFEEQQIIDMVAASRLEYVRGEAGGDWLPVYQSPFAGYAPRLASAHATDQRGYAGVAPGARGAPTPSRSLSAAQWLFVGASCGGALISSAMGWLGLAMGIALIGWTVLRHRRRQRSLMAIAWSKPVGLFTTAGTVAVGLLFSTCGASSLLVQRKASAKREALAEQQRAQAESETKAKAQQRAELEKALPGSVTGWRIRLKDALGVADKIDPKEGRAATKLVQEEVAAHMTKLGEPTPPELSSVAKQGSDQYDALDARVVLANNVQAVTVQLVAAKNAMGKQAWLEADAALGSALDSVHKIETIPVGLKRLVPKDFDVVARRAEVEQLQKAIAAPVAQTKKRIEREEEQRRARQAKEEQKRQQQEAKEAAYAALCGDRPVVSPWDGEIVGLESVLKQTAHDPDSIDVENCTNPALTQGECWRFRCNVRGKNMFGALIFQQKWYSYSKALGFQEASE